VVLLEDVAVLPFEVDEFLVFEHLDSILLLGLPDQEDVQLNLDLIDEFILFAEI
jgi:hypothetical protein